MKYIHIISIYVLATMGLYAQSNLTNGEYYWNQEPGFGNGTPLSVATPAESIDQTYTIDVPVDIPRGANALYVRFQDENGAWGISRLRYFISISGLDLEQGEYYWDEDPGVGNAIELPVATPADPIIDTYAIPVPTDLLAGPHSINVRYKDANGTWGLVKTHYFVFLTGLDLVDAEFYWDTDPGQGNGTTIPIANNSSPVNETHVLTVPSEFKGLHNLYIRYKDANGTWGPSKSRSYNITKDINLVEAEYYWDTDPGYGDATTLTISAFEPEINETYDLDISTLSNGVHNLVVRVKDEFNQWSIYTAQEYVIASPIYVDHTATGANTGASWTDAYTNLVDALAASTESNPGIIHIAEGTYYPDNDTDERLFSFEINSATTILGGYPSGGDIEDNRDPETYEVILSGDIGVEGIDDDNSYHIVMTDGVSNVSIDGLTIERGYADGGGGNSYGGGLYNDGGTGSSSPDFIDCTFRDNYSQSFGGVFYNNATNATGVVSPTFTDCVFDSNTAGSHGGVFLNWSQSTSEMSPIFTNCIFSNNVSALRGGVGYNLSNSGDSETSFVNCIFYNNEAATSGALEVWGEAEMSIINCSFANNVSPDGEHIKLANFNGRNPQLEIINTIFDDEGNDGDIFTFSGGASLNLSYSIIDGPIPTGATDGGNNLFNTNPLFNDVENGDLTLNNISPAINKGDANANTTSTDLAGNDRVIDGDIDMGAYEVQDPEECDQIGNYALEFDGIDDQVDVSNNGLAEWTIEAWVYPTANSGYRTIYARANQGFFLNGGKLEYYKSGIGTVISGSSTLPLNEWSHIAVTYDNTGMNIYLNGISEGFSGNSGLDLPEQTFHIGGHDGIEYFEGQIDELRIWSVARSATQLMEYMDNWVYSTEENLETYYNFNDGPTSEGVEDFTGNGLDGTLINMDPSTDWVCGYALVEPVPSCTDGVLNGDESNIDCGGTTCVECCADPTDFEVTMLGGTEIQMQWTPNESCVVNSEYWVQSSNLSAPVIGTGTSVDCSPTFPITVSGLTATTEYNVYVYQDCDADGISGPTLLGTFVTCPEAFTWTGAEDNLWSNPNNWCQGGLPGVGDDVILPISATNEPHVDINVDISSLEIRKPLTVLAGNTLAVQGGGSFLNPGIKFKADVTNYGVIDVKNWGAQNDVEASSFLTFINEVGATIILNGENIFQEAILIKNSTFINNGHIDIYDYRGLSGSTTYRANAIYLYTSSASFECSFVNNGTIDIDNLDPSQPNYISGIGIINGNYSSFENHGVVAMTDLGGSAIKNDNFGSFINTGDITAECETGIDNGSSVFDNTGSIIINTNNGMMCVFDSEWTNAGTLQGQGLITGDMTNTGTLIPGQSPGIITYDDAFENTGTIEFEVLGLGGAGEADGHDQLILNTDNNTLGGTIDVTSTYTANPGDQIVLISATDGYTGTFATTNLPPNESGFSWTISYEDTEVILSLGPLCYAPSDLVVDNLGETTADINWTPGGNCALDGTYWVQSTQDPPPTVGVGGETFACGGAFPVSVTGLTAGETYNVYVYESCGTGIDVGPELVGSFTTWIDCDPDGQFSLDFDGVNDDIQNIGNIGSPTEFSVEFWINPKATQTSFAQPIGYGHGNFKSWTMQRIGVNNWRMALGNGAWNFINFGLTPDAWQHIAFVVSDTEMQLYLNGVLLEGLSLSSPIQYTNNEFFEIASWYNGSNYSRFFNGSMDEVRVWNKSLIEDEILANLNSELTGTEPNLIAYYNFNEGNGNSVLNDLTSNEYDGNLTNMDPNQDWVCGFEPIPCLQASGLSTTDIGGTSATANWATNGNTDFEVIIGETGFTFGNEEMTFSVTGSSVEMTGLEEGKTYDWYVRADCDADGYSSYTGPETFTINNTTLDYSGNVGYDTHIVSPLEGLPTDLFRFEVKYTNTAGTMPTGAYPRLLIDEDGNGSNDQLVTMSEADAADTDVTDGKIYFVELTGLQPGDEYKLSVEDIKPNGYTTTLGPIDELEVLQPVDVSIFAADISFSDDNPDSSTEITVTAIITNESSYDATNFSASLYNEYDETTYPNVNNITVLSGATTDISWTITTPAEVAFVPMRVTLDIDDILVEPNELDNDAVRPFLNGPFIIGDAGINVVAELSVTEIDNVSYTTLTGTATYFGIPDQEDEPVAGGDVQFELVPLGTMFTTHTNNDGQFSYTFLTPSVGYNVEGSVTDLFFTGEFEVGPCLADITVEIEEFDFVNEDELHAFDVTFVNNGCLETSVPFTATISMPEGIPTSINVAVPALASTESHTETITVTYNDFGNKTITAETDINEDVIEFSEDNNDDVESFYVLCAGVDLRAQSVIYDPSFVIIDECGFYFNLPVRNFGVTTSIETTAKVEKMKGATLISTEYYTIPALASLGSHNISFFDTFENGPGGYSYIVTADDNEEETECIEDNQSATTSFDVIGCGRDLAIGQCYAQDITTVDGEPGDVVTISTVVRSIGGSDVPDDFDVAFITDDETITVTHTGGLADGTQVTLTADVTIPVTGSLTYTVQIDPDNTLTELSETNNTYFGELEYDFFLTEFCGQNYTMFWEKIYTPFQPINMEIGLKNWGNLQASEVGVHFEVVAGPGVTSPIDLGTALVSNVERTCGCPRSVFLANPASLSMTGTYTIRMTADGGDDYTESDETNNTYEVQVVVTSDPDFATESQFINPSELNPALDEEITFSMTYENLGETYLNPFNAKVEVDGVELEIIAVDGLIQGDDNTVAITTPWSSDVQGIHIVKWILDPLEEVGESDETNNIATRLVLVGNAPNPTITAFTVDNAGPDQGEEINFQVIIDNEGDVDADMTLRLYYYDNVGALTELYTGVHTSTADVDITIDIPWTVLETSTEILAEISAVDPQEYNEEDNTATLLLNGFDVDIAITHLTCTGADDGAFTATETGGIAPVTYLWSNGATTATITGLKAGVFSVAVTDGLGVVVNETAIVEVDDSEAPLVTCGDLTLMLNELGTASLQSSDVTIADNCDDLLSPEFSQASFGCEHLGENVVTVTATDISGNIGSCIMTVTIVDMVLPTITCPDALTVNNDEDQCYATIEDLGPYIAADNCPDHSVSNDAPATFPVGETTVTWTVTDASGNIAECTQLISVVDNQAPTIICPDALSVSADTDACTASGVDLGSPITDDNCEGESATNNAPEIFPVGTTEVTWTVTDAAGLTATCVQLVTVTDDQFPTITCPANVEVSVDADACTASDVTLGDATGADNCEGFTITNNAPTTYETGMTTVTWTITDGAGNETTCDQIVTVIEDILPLITCPSAMTVSADADECYATITDLGAANGFDNCGVFEIENDAPETFPVGETTVTYTITDAAGNSAECTQFITVTDNQVPTITCPESISVSADVDACTASEVDLGSPITDDNCGVFEIENDAPETFPVGTTEVTWTVIDAAGLTATCVQLVTVTDDQFPTITCPVDVTVSVDADACTATEVELGEATGTDNCSFNINQPEIYTGEENSENSGNGEDEDDNDPAPILFLYDFPVGVTEILWTVVDASGNETSCIQTVTVVEDILPQITCPPAMTFTADEDQCYATITDLGTPNGFDNCGVFDIVNDAPETFPVGETTVTYTITDGAGNTAECTQLITVTDDQLPTITCPDDLTMNNDIDLCSAVVALGESIVADNCLGISISNDAPEMFPVGETLVTWTATDDAGNDASCIQLITVLDVQWPIIDCPAPVTVNTQPTLCTASEIFLGEPTITENCEGYTITNDAPFTYPIGTTVVTWTVTDAADLSHTCEQSVIVVDNEAPEITCVSDDLIVLAISLTATEYIVSGDELDAIATDNCSVSVSNDYNGGSTLAEESFAVGDHTVIWTATDGSGNMVTCTIMLTVENSSCAPTFSLSDHSNNCPDDEFFIAVDISDIGLGNALDIVNDGGAPSILGVVEGIHVVGPFTAGTSVEITVDDVDDDTCFDTKTWTLPLACPDPLDYFVMTIVIHDPGEVITIPTIGSGYDYEVKWGDGISANGYAGDAMHAYADPGTYEIQIIGDFPRIYFNNEGNRQKIQSIDQWGSIEWTSMENAFYGCYAMNVLATDSPDLSMVEDMENMFRGCISLNADLSNWDVSQVTDMEKLFNEATAFNTSINDWDVSNVKNMKAIFKDATSYNQPMLSWVVSAVTNMSETFRNSAFDQAINDWDVGSVLDMSSMFKGTPFNQEIGDWDVSNVTNMRSMFFNNIVFDQDLSDWNVIAVEDMTKMFAASAYNQDLSSWNVSAVTDMNSMFDNNGQFNQDISDWNVSAVTDMKDMFNGSLSFDQDLSDWDMSAVTDAAGMFDGVTLSTFNYDNMLIYWNEQDLQSGVVFSGGNSVYCNGKDARDNMTSSDGWNITDGGYDPSACDLCTFVVSNTLDAGEGSLRSAITCANNFPGADTITFDIPGAGPHTIMLHTELPNLTGDSTVIDATTQPDNYPMNGEVIVDITDISGANTLACRIRGKYSEIYGIEFNNYKTTGNQSALYYAFGSDNFILGDSLRGNWFLEENWLYAVFTKENINGGKIQSNVFDGDGRTGIIINSGTNNIVVGGDSLSLQNEFYNFDLAAVHLVNYSNDNIVKNNYFKHNDIAIYNEGNKFSGVNNGNMYLGNTYICNDTAIVHTPSANLDILPPTIDYSKINFVSGTAEPGSIVEIYATADTCVGPNVVCAGEILIGRDSVEVDGLFHLVLGADDHIPLGYSVTATQTDTLIKGTSEFAPCVAVDTDCINFVYLCNDQYIGSLRSAIDCAVDGETVYFLDFLMDEEVMLESDICVDKSITIEGLGNLGITVMSNSNTYNMKIAQGKNVTIKDIIISVNDTGAAKILDNEGNLMMDNVTIIDKRTHANEGDIINKENATLNILNTVKVIKE